MQDPLHLPDVPLPSHLQMLQPRDKMRRVRCRLPLGIRPHLFQNALKFCGLHLLLFLLQPRIILLHFLLLNFRWDDFKVGAGADRQISVALGQLLLACDGFVGTLILHYLIDFLIV